jgi:hypothetical protein
MTLSPKSKPKSVSGVVSKTTRGRAVPARASMASSDGMQGDDRLGAGGFAEVDAGGKFVGDAGNGRLHDVKASGNEELADFVRPLLHRIAALWGDAVVEFYVEREEANFHALYLAVVLRKRL